MFILDTIFSTKNPFETPSAGQRTSQSTSHAEASVTGQQNVPDPTRTRSDFFDTGQQEQVRQQQAAPQGLATEDQIRNKLDQFFGTEGGQAREGFTQPPPGEGGEELSPEKHWQVIGDKTREGITLGTDTYLTYLIGRHALSKIETETSLNRLFKRVPQAIQSTPRATITVPPVVSAELAATEASSAEASVTASATPEAQAATKSGKIATWFKGTKLGSKLIKFAPFLSKLGIFAGRVLPFVGGALAALDVGLEWKHAASLEEGSDEKREAVSEATWNTALTVTGATVGGFLGAVGGPPGILLGMCIGAGVGNLINLGRKWIGQPVWNMAKGFFGFSN